MLGRPAAGLPARAIPAETPPGGKLASRRGRPNDLCLEGNMRQNVENVLADLAPFASGTGRPSSSLIKGRALWGIYSSPRAGRERIAPSCLKAERSYLFRPNLPLDPVIDDRRPVAKTIGHGHASRALPLGDDGLGAGSADRLQRALVRSLVAT